MKHLRQTDRGGLVREYNVFDSYMVRMVDRYTCFLFLGG